MNLLVLTQYFWPENFRINELVSSLKESGIDVTVLTGKPNYPEGEIYPGYRTFGTTHEDFNGVRVWRVPIIPRGSQSSFRLIVNYLSFIVFAGLFSPFIFFRKPIDVIFIYAPSPLLQAMAALPLKWIKGTAIVIWVQDIWPQSLTATGYIRNRSILKFVEWLVRIIYSYSDKILIQSEAFREAVTLLTDPKKIIYFPNTANETGDPKEVDICPEVINSISSIPFSVVFAGNLGTAQSLETIVEAALILRDRTDICFFLIGDGSRAAWIREQIESYNIHNIFMLGRHPLDMMPSFFAKASALLVTLREDHIFSLTVPSKIQDYLAAGRPIIAALNGEGSRIVLEAGAGVTCPAGNGTALAKAVIQLADMPETSRQKMGESGRRYCNTHFNRHQLTNDLILIIKNLKNPI